MNIKSRIAKLVTAGRLPGRAGARRVGARLATAGRHRHLRLHALEVHRPPVRVAHTQAVLVAVRVHRGDVIVLLSCECVSWYFTLCSDMSFCWWVTEITLYKTFSVALKFLTKLQSNKYTIGTLCFEAKSISACSEVPNCSIRSPTTDGGTL